MNRKVRAIIVDGTEIMTSLTAVEIADRLRTYDDLKDEVNRKDNIINTFEEDLEREVNISEQDSMVGNYRYTVIHSTLEKMLKHFKELKESGNNE